MSFNQSPVMQSAKQNAPTKSPCQLNADVANPVSGSDISAAPNSAPLSPLRYANDVVRSVLADFHARQLARRPYELSWRQNLNFVQGNQYCVVTPRGSIEQEPKFYFWQEKLVYNHVAPIVEARMARLSRVRPQPVARPFSNSDADVNSAKLATRVLGSVCNKVNLSQMISQATVWSEVCGTSFYKVCWDSAAQDVSLSVCSPFEIYPDSDECQSLAECRSVIHAKVYSAEEVKTLWGVDEQPQNVSVFATGTEGAFGGLGYDSQMPCSSQTEDTGVLVIERYSRPNAIFPNGRLEIVVGNTLVYDDDLPYLLGDGGARDFPFIRQLSNSRAGCFWGTSVVERLIPVQRAYNAVKNRKHEFLNRLALGVLVVEDGSVDTDSLEDEGLSPGKILVYRQGAEKPQLMDAGAVPEEFGKEEDRLIEEFNVISGVSELAGSGTPQGSKSGVALQLIAEQDELRLSCSVDSIRLAIKCFAKYVLRLYKQFVSQKRLARLVDGNNSAEVFYFCGSDIGSDDVTFLTENELSDTPATRRSMLMDLVNAGLLTDEKGQMSLSAKAKVLDMMGFGDWQRAQDVAQLHILRAERENLDVSKAQVLPVDDHDLHVEEHTRFIVSNDVDKLGEDYLNALLSHVAAHRAA